MATSPHSFPTHTKRLSQSSQLPLPPSLNASMSQRPHGGITISSSGQNTGPSNGLNSPTFSPRAQPSASPTTPSFPSSTLYSSPPHTSSTHAGGIQPSSLFFRPSRPAQQQQYSRPSSAASEEHPPDADHYPLSPLATANRHSLAHSSIDEGNTTANESAPEDRVRFSSLKRIKQSREPLLPIGGSPTRRPSVSATTNTTSTGRQPSGSVLPNSLSPSKSSATRTVRNSFDRMLRGMSFDSLRRKSTSSPVLEKEKQLDEEQGYPLPPHTSETSVKRPSESPLHFGSSSAPRLHSPLHAPSTSRTPSPQRSSSSSPSASPTPSFIPTPPSLSEGPPLIETPMRTPDGRPVYKYELHPSRNRFFLHGRLLTGGDSPWAFIASFGLILGLAGVWFGTTCVFWWTGGADSGGTRLVGPGGKAVVLVGAYLAALVITNMIVTATTDPGILPRNLDLDPPYPATSPSDGGIRAPMPRDLKVRSDVVRVKYCPTCKTYRPPRSSHCKMCDNCVDGCDHHCQWVNNCVGRRNYTSFFVLLLAATTILILIIVTSALHLYFLAHNGTRGFRGALSDGAGSAVAFSVAIAVIWPVAALLSYHMRLLLLNVTTIEQIRNQAHKTLVPGPPPPNPFSHGNWKRNLLAVLCRPAGYSWLEASAIAVEDRREVNPGFGNVVGQ
ncbi:DHHC palmitoyltransferase-domain-containing protein [Collybia nuda]|uniref:Palmitoyltransferase n=1 Tax=Collybia nuda TaxID=64659 RepID=A0A9P5YIM1_9AGAR|nr:DHHC palmitoyltransferase-domain-containing protein [Collybia nuda]